MTRKERAQVVELLRCAADAITLMRATEWLGYRFSHPINKAAWKAKRSVQHDVPAYRRELDGPGLTNEEYRELLLEAAQRVEDGEWP